MDADEQAMKAMGAAFRLQRETAGLTLQALSDAIGCGYSTLLKHEHGRSSISSRKLVRAAAAIGCSLDALCGYSPPDLMNAAAVLYRYTGAMAQHQQGKTDGST